MIIDFSHLQTKMVLEGLITQVVLPFNEETQRLQKGHCCNISFEGIQFRNYGITIEKITHTTLDKLGGMDMFHQGFLYKPAFDDFMQKKGFDVDETILKVDFKLRELNI